jgi:hypothetical protein
VDLRRRLRSLEQCYNADRCDQHPVCDLDSADSAFRQRVREWADRLHAEERTSEQIRKATWQMIVAMWDKAVTPGHASTVAHENLNFDEEWNAAVAALGEENTCRLRAACEAAIIGLG